jgi:hypothetical protein
LVFPNTKRSGFVDIKALGLTMLTTIAILSAFVYSYYYPTFTFFENTPFPITTITNFFAGIAFFGYFAFIPGILFGLQLGAEKNAAIFLYLIPTIIATYAGTKLGFALQDDFSGKKDFFRQGKIILLFFLVAIILAITVELSLPAIIEYWPKDFLGMNVMRGKSTVSLITDLAKYRR